MPSNPSERRRPSGWQRPPVPGPVTVCVISYNYGRFLREAVDSALAQTHPGTRVMIVDDGSTDDTPAIAASYGAAVDYLGKENGGLSDARNAGATRCETPWMLYLDADNAIPPEHLERLFDSLAREPEASFAYGQLRYFGDREGLTSFGTFDVERLKRGNYIDAGALLPTDLVRAHPFDTSLRAGLEDWDFFLGVAAGGHVGALAETSTRFRVHGSNMGIGVQRRSWRRRATYARIFVKHRRFLGAGFVTGMLRRSLRSRVGAAR